MAAEESSQEAALGPEISESGADGQPAEHNYPSLDDVLGEFMEALCVIDVIARTLNDLPAEEVSDGVGSCTVALRHGFEMLDAVYNRFDEGLIGYHQSGGDDGPEGLGEDEDSDDDDDEGGAGSGQKVAKSGGVPEDSTSGKRSRLALVA
jgi:hypothetical protein